MEIKDGDKVIATVTAADANVGGCDEGIWIEVKADDGTRPTICLIKDKPKGPHSGAWYLGVYRDVNKAGIACDFAILFDKNKGPQLQVVKGSQVKIINLFDHLMGEVK